MADEFPFLPNWQPDGQFLPKWQMNFWFCQTGNLIVEGKFRLIAVQVK
jgi:hypothetical protein